MKRLLLILFCGLILSGSYNYSVAQDQKLQTPAQFLGKAPGSDRTLFTYEEIVNYFKYLESHSNRLKMFNIGTSAMGKPIYMAVISSAQNLQNLEDYKKINKSLALDFTLSEETVEQLAQAGKVFFLATLSMHANEVGPSQASPVTAYTLVSATKGDTIKWLNNVVFMMVISHNPDGMDMVVEHYKKYLGTPYEASRLPGVYHKYVGHDINRDFVTLTQPENKAISYLTSKEWFPQVMVEKHEMGTTAPRYYVPPNHDPIAENIDAELWNWMGVFGSNLITQMTAKGLKGVVQHYLFDNYWIGSTESCLWKNVIAFLTESASAKTATPVYVELNELNPRGKGLSEYKKSVNMPDPWPGGWWRLSDVVEYEVTSTLAAIKTCSEHKYEILKFRNQICKKEVRKGLSEPPFYFIFPVNQSDRSELVNFLELMDEHGIYTYITSQDIKYKNKLFPAGSVVIPLAQPFRAFIKEVIEKQKFPERHYTPDGELIRPYDITSWSLPLHRGLSYEEINDRILQLDTSMLKLSYPLPRSFEIPDTTKQLLLLSGNNESYKIAFMAIEKGLKVHRTTVSVMSGNLNIPSGSFIIENKGEAFKELSKEIKIAPLFITGKNRIPMEEVKIPRIALVETWYHDMDAGWTRYLLDTYHIPYKVLHPADIKETDLTKNFDVIIFPDANKDILLEGKIKNREGEYFPTFYPPEYTKGMGKEGKNNLYQFISQGGKIISWGKSTELFCGPQTISKNKDEKESFWMPVINVTSSFRNKGLYCPGSLLKISWKRENPLFYGINSSLNVFYRGNPVLKTRVPDMDMDRRVLASFPGSAEDILVSGYARKIELLENIPAIIWVKKGKGQILLFSFNPQFRASTTAAFKLIFNGILFPENYQPE